MYVGLGYDVHTFKSGRPLILGGVKIDYSIGLFGHSDADVVVHALMDAILGAAGLHDIGHLFPNNNPKYKNISSIILLETVVSKLKSKKYKVNNVDITVIAEEPKIAPYCLKMKNILSKKLCIPAERISIKATTNEKMGFIGRGEGIAAIAIASVVKTGKGIDKD